MNRQVAYLFLIALLGLIPVAAFAQGPPAEIDLPNGKVIVPGSSAENSGDHGKKAHTNHLILEPQKGPPSNSRTPVGETPGSAACVYGTSAPTTPNCPITGNVGNGNHGLPNASGGAGVIAIVDAYDYPTAESDLNTFSAQFGLPACTSANGCFQKVYGSGTKPSADCGWAQEAALDIEWAHAMAPGAKIVLVEAKSNSFADLLTAVDKASSIVAAGPGNGQVSMSWGGSEFSSEAANDFHFTTPNVVYFAASGDTGGKNIWPGVSPNVVSAGGTSINRNSSGNFVNETAWSGSGGGPSQYESRPVYQNSIQDAVGAKRGSPDFSFDANPNAGVWVYDSTSCQRAVGWLIFGGTSVASPSLAGIVNLSGSFASSSPAELTTIYGICGGGAANCSSANFRDITSGTAGSFTTKTGWDFVTGVGSNAGTAGK